MEKPSSLKPGSGHARLERGLDETPRSRVHKGRFGRMFRLLPPADFDDAALVALAKEGEVVAEPERNPVTKRLEVTPETKIDNEENFNIPAGYTYFGQFVDHDITFDPLSSLVKRNDPDGITNFRTPALDLDGLYGRGPNDQPYLYEKDGRRFLLGDRSLMGSRRDAQLLTPLTRDLPRFHGRALIGDPRNDENIIVSQLHGLFLRFHNFLADKHKDYSFARIQRLVRWHYQWLVLFDYLPRIVGRQMVEKILPHIADGSNIYDRQPQIHFFNYRNDPFMPVEFSGAAYRFGHSMIRPVYRLSAHDFGEAPDETELKDIDGIDGRKLLFHPNPKIALNGFHEFDAKNGIDWHLFFETRDHSLSPKKLGKGRVQPAYKIDTSLVNHLAFLPEFSKGKSNKPEGAAHTNNLAFRNLKRGVTLQLPSGQSVARFMGLEPIPDERLLVGKATAENLVRDPKNKSGLKLKSIIDIDDAFTEKAPLWFYVLAEALDEWRKKAEQVKTDAQKDAQPTLLGPVGGRIVAEVLIGLILGDNDSFLQMEPNWKPFFGDEQAENVFDRFTMGDLIEVLPHIRP